ncbi:BTAD domain-containing putative transcriptional regulator [Rhodopila sp.]|uniref:BTAD domain-containing putative transcriptional regulator n=1 Tax=Rhodopila sp. TaxID=2480087 RepID=UPI003D0BB638
MDDQQGRTFLPRTRKTRALLAILAMATPKPVLRLHLAALLWSQREQEQARASLRQSVHELQDTLGYNWSHLLVADRHNLTLRGTGLHIDAASLTQPTRDMPDVLERFRVVLLEDLSGLDPAFDRWLDEERARFARIGRTIGESLLARCSNPVAAIETAEQLLAIDRTHEGAWRAMMRAHVDRGDRGMALTTYDRCCTALAESTHARPSPETEDLISRIRDAFADGQIGGLSLVPVAPASSPSASSFRPDMRRDRQALRLCIAPLRILGPEVDDGFAGGLAEEISAGLSRFRWISCVPATLWQGTADGNPADATWAGLGGDLVLDGTIQRAAGRLRIIARLIDMRSGGEIVWAGRFDRDMTDPLGLQDEVGAAIVAQVDPELMKYEGRRNAGRQRSDLTAQDLLLQALPALYRMERDAFLEARRLLEASLRSDPGSSVVHGWLAYWNLLFVGQGWATDPDRFTAEAAELAERAVMLDPSDARALTLAGHVRGFLGKHPEEATALHERALTLNPNLAVAWCFSGLSHSYIGRHDEALHRITQARHLSPSDPHVFFFDMALIMPYLMRGDYANAIEVGRRSIELNPWFSSAYKGYLAALGHMDRPREAGEVLRRLLSLEPNFSVHQAMVRSPLSRPEDIARYAEGLRRAGLPEISSDLSGQTPALLIDHSPVDLISAPPHSPVARRDDPRAIGGFSE